jgi:hypothetical protein
VTPPPPPPTPPLPPPTPPPPPSPPPPPGAMALGQVQLTLDGEPLVPMAVKPTVAVAPGASVPS